MIKTLPKKLSGSFYKLWTKKETLMIDIHSIIFFINQLIIIHCYCWGKEHQKKWPILSLRNPESVPSNEPDVQLQAIELDELVQSTISSMPEKVRRIFELSRFEGLKYKEIAVRLSISVKTVEANMGKALKLFRQNLKVQTAFKE